MTLLARQMCLLCCELSRDIYSHLINFEESTSSTHQSYSDSLVLYDVGDIFEVHNYQYSRTTRNVCQTLTGWRAYFV